jgi:hypothetical protein
MPNFSLFHNAPDGSKFQDAIADVDSHKAAILARLAELPSIESERYLLGVAGVHDIVAYELVDEPQKVHEPIYGGSEVFMFLLVVKGPHGLCSCRAGTNRLEAVEELSRQYVERLARLGKIQGQVNVHAAALGAPRHFEIVMDGPQVWEVVDEHSTLTIEA